MGEDYEYELHEHNFQNNPGNKMVGMNAMVQKGWELADQAINFPYVHALWRRLAGSSDSPSQGSQVQQLTDERDKARDVARQLKAERDQLQSELDQLRDQLRAQQSAAPSPEQPGA
jgi:hypothetical protein